MGADLIGNYPDMPTPPSKSDITQEIALVIDDGILEFPRELIIIKRYGITSIFLNRIDIFLNFWYIFLYPIYALFLFINFLGYYGAIYYNHCFSGIFLIYTAICPLIRFYEMFNVVINFNSKSMYSENFYILKILFITLLLTLNILIEIILLRTQYKFCKGLKNLSEDSIMLLLNYKEDVNTLFT